MKNFNPLWFIGEPIDPEHKEYILLDYLKSLTKKLSTNTSYSILREISRIVKVLNEFKEKKEISTDILKGMKKDSREYFQNFKFKDLDLSLKYSIEEIIEASLNTLYDYSEVCLEILKEEEAKIKIFRVESKTLLYPDKSNSGILIIRNMVTDAIEAYRWQGSVILKTLNGDKEVCIMKKISIKNIFITKF